MTLDPTTSEALLELTICAFAVYLIGCVVRHHWINRRLPTRRDAPTGRPWITPNPRVRRHD